MNDIKMFSGCSACGGSDLSVKTRGVFLEITCCTCGHLEEIVNSKTPPRTTLSSAALLGTLEADRGDDEYWG